MSYLAVEQLLLERPADLGQQLLAVPESQWFERKSGRIEAKSAARTLIGFANAEGGVLIIGLSNGTIDGVSTKRLNELQQMAMTYTEPTVPCSIDAIEVNADGSKRTVAVIRVRPGDGVVYASQVDKVFLRVGDSTRELGFQERRELSFDRGQTTYERNPLHGELNAERIEQYATAMGSHDPPRLLRARGLVLNDGTETVAAQLLFGANVEALLPNAHIRIVRYKGTTTQTGARQQLEFDQRIEGPLPTQLTFAHRALKEIVPTRQALGADGRFGPIGIVPEAAWLEAIVNAAVHRSYSVAGDHIRVSVFDDRVECESPGRFPGIVDLAYPANITRFARNPRIARVLADLRFGQELGEGIRRMFEEMRLAGLAEPEFFQTAGSVIVTLRSSLLDPTLDERLPPRWREAMQIIRNDSRASTGNIADALDMTRPTAIKLLRAMQNVNLIKWVGTSSRDPRAYWKPQVE